MSLRPDSYEERVKRARQWQDKKREAARRYERKKRAEGRKHRSIGSNPERRKKNYEIAFGDKADWIRGLCCLVCGMKPAEPHHYPTRAAGGTKKDLTPLCRKHHRMFHDLGAETWQERFDVNLLEAAARLDRRWRERGET